MDLFLRSSPGQKRSPVLSTKRTKKKASLQTEKAMQTGLRKLTVEISGISLDPKITICTFRNVTTRLSPSPRQIFFLCYKDILLWQKQLKGEKVCSSSQCKAQSLMVRKSGQRELKAAGHITSTIRKNSFPFSTYTIQDPSQGMRPPTVNGFSHFNECKQYNPAQRPISHTISDPVKLTTNANPHRLQIREAPQQPFIALSVRSQ